MTKLIYYLPGSTASSPAMVATKVWEHLYACRIDLEMDLKLVPEDPRDGERYQDVALGPEQVEGRLSECVFYFPISPVLGLGTAFRILFRLHRRGARLVSDFHGDLREDLRSHYKNRDLRLMLYSLPSAITAPRVINWHEWIVLHSRTLEGILRSRYDVKPGVAVVPNGIDRWLLDRPMDRMDLEGELTVAYHGRLTHEKGVDLLIRAVASLPARLRDRTHVYIYGGGPKEGSLRRMANRLRCARQVHFMGHHPVEEVLPTLASADLLVYPSRVDNFPVSVLEALAVARAPVLFSDRMGIGEFAGPALAGNVIPPTVDGIRRALVEALDSDEEASAIADDVVREQRACARRYTWEKVAREYVAFFNTLD